MLFFIIEDKAVLPVIGLFKSLLESVLHRAFLITKVSDDVEFFMRRLLEHFLLNMLVLCTALKHYVIQRCILVQCDETKIVLVTESFVELFYALVCFVTIDSCIKLGVDNKDNTSAHDVVMA